MAKPRPRPVASTPCCRSGREGAGAAQEGRVGRERIEREPAPGLQRARDAGEEARELPIGLEMLDGVERRDREQEAAPDREPAQIPAQQQGAAANGGGRPAEPRRRPRQHRGRPIDADDGVTGAQQRQHEPAGAAAEIEDRTAALVRQRAVEGDVVAPPPVLPVVQHGVFEWITAAACRGNVRA